MSSVLLTRFGRAFVPWYVLLMQKRFSFARKYFFFIQNWMSLSEENSLVATLQTRPFHSCVAVTLSFPFFLAYFDVHSSIVRFYTLIRLNLFYVISINNTKTWSGPCVCVFLFFFWLFVWKACVWNVNGVSCAHAQTT